VPINRIHVETEMADAAPAEVVEKIKRNTFAVRADSKDFTTRRVATAVHWGGGTAITNSHVLPVADLEKWDVSYVAEGGAASPILYPVAAYRPPSACVDVVEVPDVATFRVAPFDGQDSTCRLPSFDSRANKISDIMGSSFDAWCGYFSPSNADVEVKPCRIGRPYHHPATLSVAYFEVEGLDVTQGISGAGLWSRAGSLIGLIFGGYMSLSGPILFAMPTAVGFVWGPRSVGFKLLLPSSVFNIDSAYVDFGIAHENLPPFVRWDCEGVRREGGRPIATCQCSDSPAVLLVLKTDLAGCFAPHMGIYQLNGKNESSHGIKAFVVNGSSFDWSVHKELEVKELIENSTPKTYLIGDRLPRNCYSKIVGIIKNLLPKSDNKDDERLTAARELAVELKAKDAGYAFFDLVRVNNGSEQVLERWVSVGETVHEDGGRAVGVKGSGGVHVEQYSLDRAVYVARATQRPDEMIRLHAAFYNAKGNGGRHEMCDACKGRYNQTHDFLSSLGVAMHPPKYPLSKKK
jgi:hypothetical protein